MLHNAVLWQSWAQLTNFPSFIHRNWKFPVLSKIFPPPPLEPSSTWGQRMVCIIGWYIARFSNVYQGVRVGPYAWPLRELIILGEICAKHDFLTNLAPGKMIDLTEIVLYLLTSEPGILLLQPCLLSLSPALTEFYLSSLVVLRRSWKCLPS